MSKQVDDRVVSLEFDNKNFESNVKTSMGTLDKLKQALNMKDASQGLEQVDKAAQKVNFNPLARGVEQVQLKFSALQVVATTALANIANSAVNAGKQLVSAMTIDSVMDGFREYETQINAVQTILSNTKSKGTTIDNVNDALDELNEYADKTIYNFGEMTKNIGTFTAAGVDLEKAVAAIKGIANLGAMSGSTSVQVSGAMYQLSQALAAGRVSLMDWNSVVNAGMGGEQFQNALKRTAEHFGYDVDAMIEKYGSFRESLTQGGWLTAEVLTETLNQISGAYTEADLIAQGYTEDQAHAIIEMANTAEEAATKVTTFTKLIDTLKEAMGSGWAQSFEIMIGDYEEAKELFTEINDVLGGAISESANYRNQVLDTWANSGGRENVIKGLSSAFNSLASILGTVRDAFNEVFPPITGTQLINLSHGFRDLMESLTPTAETLDRIKRIAKGVFSGFDLIGKGISAVLKPIGELIFSDGVGGFTDKIFEMVASVGDFITILNEGTDADNFFSSISESLSKAFGVVSDGLSKLSGGMDSFQTLISSVAQVIGEVFKGITDTVGGALGWIADNISAGDIFAGLAGGGIFALVTKLSGLIDKIKDALEGLFGDGADKGGSAFSDILDQVHNSLSSFTTGLNVGSLVGIAAAVTMLSVALGNLAELKVPQIATSLTAMSGLIGLLNGSFALMAKTLSKYGSKGTLKSSVALIAMAAAINIFADAMTKVSDLDLDQIGKGLLALGGGLAEMVGALTVISKFSGGASSIAGALGILIAVQALSDISDALRDIGALDWETIGKGLVGMGGALFEISGLTAALGKISGVSSIFAGGAILIVAQSLKPIGEALSSIGKLSWEEIARGLVGIGVALLELAGMTAALDKISGMSSIFASGAILITAQALEPIGDALSSIGKLSWEEIARGLVGMGVALLELAAISGVLGKVAGISGILGSGAILIAAQALEPIGEALSKIGELSWEEIARGLVGMGVALAEIAVVSGALGALTGIAGIAGAGTIAIATSALDEIAEALKKFGEMSWDEIGRGLAAMGGALGEIALGSLANTLGIIGSMSISNVAEPLGTLADSVKKWVGIEVPDNFGANLTDLARGVEAFTFGGWGADSISTVAAPLGTLADSVAKWAGITVPEGISGQFQELAGAVEAFTWSGFAGGGLESIAAPLGTLADSVAKWAGITVPENMQTNLEGLAQGVKAFDWSFGWSMDSFVEPLGKLADSVTKWNGVTVPTNINDMLSSLAQGVKSFDWSWGWSLDSYIDPLDKLAEVLPKYSGLAIATDIGSSIESLGNGVTTLTNKNPGDITGVVDAIDDLADAVKKIGEIDFVSASSQITSFTDALGEIEVSSDAFTNLGTNLVNGLVTSIQNGTAQVQTAVNSLVSVIGITFLTASVTLGSSGMTAGLSIAMGISSGIAAGTAIVQASAVALGFAVQTGVSANIGSFAASGILMASSLAAGISSGSGAVLAAAIMITSVAAASANSQAVLFITAGILASNSYAGGIGMGTAQVSAAVLVMIAVASRSAASANSAFRTAGYNAAIGFANGINSGAFRAKIAARAMANAAVQAAQETIDSHSPSRVFMEIGGYASEGMAIGITKATGKVVTATENMAQKAVDGTVSAVSQIAAALDSDIDYEPTITPVVDLSNVESGAVKANSMLGNLVSGATLGNVKVVGGLVDASNQNGAMDEVVKAIKHMDGRLDSIGKPTYNVNGITYDDGSNISAAVSDLVHAVKMERRI